MVKLFRFRRTAEQAPGPAGSDPDLPTSAVPASAADGEPERAAEEAELAALMAETTARTRGGVLGRLGRVLRRGGGIDDDLWEELEEILITADVGVRTVTTLLERVQARAKQDGARDAADIRAILEAEMVALLERPRERGRLWTATPQEGAAEAAPPPPQVILVVGVNGAGKTTSIAKLAHAYGQEGKRVILGAGDTFRAAAIEQLQHWGERVGAQVIAHQQGADPGAVAYDTISAALARGADLAIIDTAGRLQNKKNLMAELAKVRGVIGKRLAGAPHEVLLVLDATTGQNGLQQARVFTEVTEVTGICLAKLDGTSKGGIVFAIADELDVPVRFVGTGEKATDLAPFDARIFVRALFGEEDG